MNRTVLGRLVWKEYRLMRGFWLSLLGLALLAQVATMLNPTSDLPRRSIIFAFAVGASIFYLLGCAAATFSGEREDRTRDFLRSLAPSVSQVFVGKAGFAFGSAVLLLGILWLSGWSIAQGEAWTMTGAHRVRYFLWLGLQFFAWGLFYSLLMSRPLQAVCFAGATSALVVGGIDLVFFPSGLRIMRTFDSVTRLDAGWITVQLLVAGLVLLVDIRLAKRWLGRTAHGTSDASMSRASRSARHQAFGRLLWQEARQARPTMLVLLVAVIVLIVFASGGTGTWIGFYGLDLWMFAMVLIAMVGACVFLSEQEGRRYRFFAEQGIGPRRVWLAKQMVWGAFAVSMIGLVFLLAVGLHGPRFSVGVRVSEFRSLEAIGGYVLGYCAFGYCIGQLASMTFRRGIIAWFSSVVAALLLCGWFALQRWLETPLLWTVYPLPVVFLLTTWWRAPDWVLERSGPRAWCKHAVPVLACVFVLGFTIAFRVYQIPKTDPGFDIARAERPVTPAAAETAEIYRQAIAAVSNFDADPELSLSANQQALSLTLQAAQRDECALNDPRTIRFDSVLRDVRGSRSLAMLILLDARRLESEGELDEAQDRYVAGLRMAGHVAERSVLVQWLIAGEIERDIYANLPDWAAHSDQTKERILSTVTEIDALARKSAPASESEEVEDLVLRRIFDGDLAELAPAFSYSDPSADFWSQRDFFRILLFVRLMPWERVRAQRLLNLTTHNKLSKLESVEKWLSDDQSRATSDDFLAKRPSEEIVRWISNTVLTSLVLRTGESVAFAEVNRAMRRRAIRLLLACEAYRTDHGKLPKSLDLLVPEYLARLPRDPYGAEFDYRPDGFPTPVAFVNSRDPVPAGRPLIWSAGAGGCRIVEVSKTPDGHSVFETRRAGPAKTSVGPGGIAFPFGAVDDAAAKNLDPSD